MSHQEIIDSIWTAAMVIVAGFLFGVGFLLAGSVMQKLGIFLIAV